MVTLTVATEIRILHLEDDPNDAEVIASLLAADGMSCQIDRVDSRRDFISALHGARFDLILSDYTLPSFDGLSALQLAHDLLPEIPFIFVTGSMGEEVAIESIKSGATDYVLKQRLTRLVPSVRRALKDLDERKERERLKGMVYQADKMAGMGQIAAGVAHELNNPLMGILGFVQLLLQNEGLSVAQRNDLEVIETQSYRCRDIIRDLLQFSSKKDSRKEPIEIGPVLESTLRLVQNDFFTSGLEIVKSISDPLPRIFGDAAQLQQVFLNLMINAKHAMEGTMGGRLLVEAEEVNGQALLRFKDNGCGISPVNIPKIFELFFTTKPVGKGTGLGLSISYEIVKQHGGDIDVQSQEGLGTSFTLKLPSYAASEEDLDAA